jgi:hypothetical protein
MKKQLFWRLGLLTVLSVPTFAGADRQGPDFSEAERIHMSLLTRRPLAELKGKALRIRAPIPAPASASKYTFTETLHNPPGVSVMCEIRFAKAGEDDPVRESLPESWVRVEGVPTTQRVEDMYIHKFEFQEVDSSGAVVEKSPIKGMTCISSQPIDQRFLFTSLDHYLFPRVEGMAGPPDKTSGSSPGLVLEAPHGGKGLIESQMNLERNI